MKSVIAFRDGRRVNLAFGVAPALYAELEATHSPKREPAFFCGGCGGGLFIQHGRRNRDELFGYHHVANGCAETFVISGAVMSDEHKRQVEYHVRAAQLAGLGADVEVVTTGRTRVDLVVDGHIGFEVQRSQLTKAAAVDRTARSVASGLDSVAWFTDAEARPPWTGHVPGYMTTLRGWKELPRERTAGATGIYTVEAERRQVITGGRYRTQHVPQLVRVPMLVDDVVPALAAAELRPVYLGKYVRLIRAEGIELWEEMTGTALAYDPGRPRPQALARSEESSCRRPAITPIEEAPRLMACTWCRHPFSEEAIRFRLTIHPRCADERAELKANYRETAIADAGLCPGSVLTIHSTPTRK